MPPDTCKNGKKDGGETDVDCGGSCTPCVAGKGCIVGADCASGEGETRGGERDPAHVVQVDDDEREDDPVAQRVDDSAGLDEPDLPGQHRVEAAEIRSQRFHEKP